jgi:glycosyltransferase involved in cell wall biosynthesis
MVDDARVPERIRIAHCITAMAIGGAETQLAELISRLPPERFEQMLVLVMGGGQLLDRVRTANCRVVELGFGLTAGQRGCGSYLRLAAALARYRRELLAFRPHVVHGQLYWGNLFSVAAARLAGVPSIVTSRLALSVRDRQPRWKGLAEDVAHLFTTAVFANSEAVRRDVLAYERVRPEIVTVIPNGVALERYGAERPEPVRRELGLPERSVVLVNVANLHPVKGHADLLRAVALLRERHPDLRLLLPGRDYGILPRLQALVRELDLRERVMLLGERRDVPRLLAAADIVVHPSHAEGFSNAVLEGMSAGRPVVATAVGGTPEAMRDGVDGLLVPPRDPAALAAAIDRLASDVELRLRMGQRARQRVEEQFSMERMVQRFAAWYEALASGRAAGQRMAEDMDPRHVTGAPPIR